MYQTPQTPQALRVRRAPAQALSVGYDRLSMIGVGREQTSSPAKPGRRFGDAVVFQFDRAGMALGARVGPVQGAILFFRSVSTSSLSAFVHSMRRIYTERVRMQCRK